MSRRVDVRFDDNVAILEMTNGKNEFTHEFVDDLNTALDQILSNPDVQALVTYGGSQGKHYSNGIDLATVGAEGMHSSLDFSRKFTALMARITLLPLPTVAAINGHGFAGGCIMALAHDYRVMNSQRGWLCLPEVNMPQLFPLTLLHIIKAKIPAGSAQRELIVLGRRVTAQAGAGLGVVDELAAPREVLARAVTLARSLVTGGGYGREILGDMKADVYRDVADSLDPAKFNFVTHYVLKSKF